jgi:hypothetical protein
MRVSHKRRFSRGFVHRSPECGRDEDAGFGGQGLSTCRAEFWIDDLALISGSIGAARHLAPLRSSDLVVDRHGPTLTDRAAKSSTPVLAAPRMGRIGHLRSRRAIRRIRLNRRASKWQNVPASVSSRFHPDIGRRREKSCLPFFCSSPIKA